MTGHEASEPEVGQAGAPSAWALRCATRIVVVLAAAALALPGSVGTLAAWMAVGMLIVTPVARVVWLAGRWFRRGDRRYAWIAVALAATILAGAVLARITNP